MSLEIYLTTSEKPPDYREPDVYNCLIWAVKPVKQRQPSFLYDSSSPGSVWTTPTSRKQSAATMRRVNKSDLAALGFPKPGEMRVVEIGPCEELINAEDIPELCYSPQYLAEYPPEDQYMLMEYVDQWAAAQCIDDTGFKQHGLAWLALDELARIEYCEAYLGAFQDRNLP